MRRRGEPPFGPPGPSRPPEEELQRTVVQWLRYLLRSAEQRSGQAPWIFFHPPNGGGRSKAEAGIFNALGVLAGVPDLVFVLEGGRAAFIELKREGWKGQLEGGQHLVQKWCRDCNVPHEVATSLELVQEALIRWGMLKPAGGASHIAIAPSTWPPVDTAAARTRQSLLASMSRTEAVAHFQFRSKALSRRILELPLAERIRLSADLHEAGLPASFVSQVLVQILEEIAEVEP